MKYADYLCWDISCPNCYGTTGGTAKNEEEVEKWFGGKILFCPDCETYFDYDTSSIIAKDDLPKDKDIVTDIDWTNG